MHELDELNAAVATEVMGDGYIRMGGGTVKTTGPYVASPWSPATDISDAFEVVELMEATHYARMQTFAGEWMVDFFPRESKSSYGGALLATLPRAICEAALKAVRQ